jgi:hypothetical protein
MKTAASTHTCGKINRSAIERFRMIVSPNWRRRVLRGAVAK